jgi:hypothetical protein
VKYSIAANYPTQSRPLINRKVFDSHLLSRSGALERKARLLSAACYFGLAPLLWYSGVLRQQNRLLKHHLLYSLAFAFTTLCVLVVDLFSDVIQYWVTVYAWNPTMDEFRASPILIWILCDLMAFIFGLITLLWGSTWLAGVICAWRGRTTRIPILAWAASNSIALHLGVYWSLLVEISLALAIGVGVHSMHLAHSLADKGDVYILYTQGGYIPIDGLYQTYTPPRWAVTMAFYPLVRAGMEKYGAQGVAVLPLSEASFNEAIHNGRFIFVASHGGDSSGSFTISYQPYRAYLPADVVQSQAGEQLQYVYFAGCWTGDRAAEWRQVLGLEDGKMFNRLSFVNEHMMWAWLKSPAVIAALE